MRLVPILEMTTMPHGDDDDDDDVASVEIGSSAKKKFQTFCRRRRVSKRRSLFITNCFNELSFTTVR